jgi:hypothetical protein
MKENTHVLSKRDLNLILYASISTESFTAASLALLPPEVKMARVSAVNPETVVIREGTLL